MKLKQSRLHWLFVELLRQDSNYEIFLPVFTIGVCFSMTRTTKGNAVLRVSIFLHIIDVMNRFAAFATNSADIIISFSDHALELAVERGRVWLERKPALPRMGVGAGFVNRSPFIMTLSGTKSTTLVTRVNKKTFSTMRANLVFGPTSPPRRPVSFKFMRRMTGLGTIKSCLFENLVNKIGLTTIEAQSFNLSALPVGSFITNKMLRSPLTKTLTRTKSGRVFAERINLKALTTMLAYYLDLGFTIPVWHLVSKRSTPYAARAFAHTARA